MAGRIRTECTLRSLPFQAVVTSSKQQETKSVDEGNQKDARKHGISLRIAFATVPNDRFLLIKTQIPFIKSLPQCLTSQIGPMVWLPGAKEASIRWTWCWAPVRASSCQPAFTEKTLSFAFLSLA